MLGAKLSEAYKFWVVEVSVGRKIIMVISGSILLTLFGFSAFADFIVPYDPIEVNMSLRHLAPSVDHPFGTDHLGRDVLSRVIYGSRASLMPSVLAVVITLMISLPLGLISAYRGGKLDRVLALFMDSLYVFPRLVLAILIAYLLGREAHLIAMAIAIASVPSFFRVTRSIALTGKERLFVESSKALGGSDWHILRYCILPQVIPPVIALAALTFGDAILAIASLGFLGLGIPPPTPEWGTDLAISREFLARGAWWTIVFPGLAIIIAVFGFLTIGETLNEIVKPQLKRR